MKCSYSITVPKCCLVLTLTVSAFAAYVQGQEPDHSHEAGSEQCRPRTITSPTGVEMIVVCAGDFMMGATDETDALPRELPRHKVTISRDFLLGKYEITRAQFVNVLGFDESSYPKKSQDGDDGAWKKWPVTSVTWYDAVHFCNALSEREGFGPYYGMKELEKRGNSIIKGTVAVLGGKGYRLPTMAEWEYACRADTTTTFSVGDNLTDKDANILKIDEDRNTAQPRAVGSYRANAWGFYDMHGNVAEWCFDWADDEINKVRRAVDPINDTDRLGLKSTRGGSWAEPATLARCSMSGGEKPGTRLNGIGMRVARTADAPKK